MADLKPDKDLIAERPDAFWRRVYLAVVACTFLVVTALWAFSRYFGA